MKPKLKHLCAPWLALILIISVIHPSIQNAERISFILANCYLIWNVFSYLDGRDMLKFPMVGESSLSKDGDKSQRQFVFIASILISVALTIAWVIRHFD